MLKEAGRHPQRTDNKLPNVVFGVTATLLSTGLRASSYGQLLLRVAIEASQPSYGTHGWVWVPALPAARVATGVHDSGVPGNLTASAPSNGLDGPLFIPRALPSRLREVLGSATALANASATGC